MFIHEPATNGISASWTELMRQAGSTAAEYMARARKEIDSEFGEGYAIKHPELVAVFMQVAASDFNSAANAVAAEIIGREVAMGLDKIADALRE